MKKRAVIVVDLQNEYLSTGKLPLVNLDPAVSNAAEIIAQARARGEMLVHVKHESSQAGAKAFVPSSTGADFISEVAPADGEQIVVKNYPNSFRDTSLKQVLEDNKIQELIVIGAMSHMCVEATTRATADLGYPVTVVQDACATMDLEFNGAKVAAAQVHATAMAALAFGYASVVTTKTFLISCR